jgi:hypothetical protein
MIFHKVSAKTRQELNDWLAYNIADQKGPGIIEVISEDRSAKGSRVVAELKARGWTFGFREWDYFDEDNPRAILYWLNGNVITILGCLELLGENETLAGEKAFQAALKNAEEASRAILKLFGKLNM